MSLEVREGLKLPFWLPILTGLIVAALVVGSYLSVSSNLDTQEVEIKHLKFKLADFEEVIKDKDAALMERDYLQGKRDFVQGISENQKQWTDFFDQMRDRVPKDVWFSKFQGSRNGEYKIEGFTFTFSSVGFAMLQMKSITHVGSVILGQTASEGGGGSGKGGGDPIASITKKFSLSGTMELLSAEERKKKQESEKKKGPGGATTPGGPGAPGPTTSPGGKAPALPEE